MMGGNSVVHVTLLLFGSFNPPTMMHRRALHLAKDTAEKDGYTNITGIVSPVNDLYGKRDLLSGEHRFHMANLTFQQDSWVTVSDWEIKQDEWKNTLSVVEHFQGESKAKFGSVKVVLVCGSDLLKSMLNPAVWPPESLDRLLSITSCIVITRSDMSIQECQDIIDSYEVLKQHKDAFRIIEEWFGQEISSTKVRKALSIGYPVTGIIDPAVKSYINEKNLYGAVR